MCWTFGNGAFLDFHEAPEIISSRHAENTKRLGKPPSPNVQVHFHDIRTARTVGHRERLVGVSKQAQTRRLPYSLTRSSQLAASYRSPRRRNERDSNPRSHKRENRFRD